MTARSIFYGWWVVAAFCVTTFISTGIRHAVGPFLKPIVGDLGLDRASFSLVIAVSLLLYGVFMPIAGMLLDRFSVRAVTTVGTVLLVISLGLTAMVRNFWEFAAVYGVLVPLGLVLGKRRLDAYRSTGGWFRRPLPPITLAPCLLVLPGGSASCSPGASELGVAANIPACAPSLGTPSASPPRARSCSWSWTASASAAAG